MIDIERSLDELGTRIEWPAEADLAAAVHARITAAPARRERAWRPLAYAAAVVALVGAATLVSFPGVRTAVAEFLGLGGVAIEQGGPRPSPADELNLGEVVTLTEASERVDFDVVVPVALGEPDTVYLDKAVSTGQVALAYEAGPGLPAAPGTSLGALITEFTGARPDEPTLEKVTAGDPDTRVVPVTVDGDGGLWIVGAPHTIAYLERDGGVRADTVRLAGNVLLWERGEVTLRLESRLTKAEAVAVAESMR